MNVFLKITAPTPAQNLARRREIERHIEPSQGVKHPNQRVNPLSAELVGAVDHSVFLNMEASERGAS